MTSNETEPGSLQGVIITDCRDPNAQARLQLRFSSLFGVVPTFIGLGGGENADLEAAGQLVDVLDANQTPGDYPQNNLVVLVNVAPRGDDIRKKWENGTPFCCFEAPNAMVVSTYEGRPLSLVHKLGIVGSLHLLDIPKVTEKLTKDKSLTVAEAIHINQTQFRSLQFQPLAAWNIYNGIDLQPETVNFADQPEVDSRVWFVDSFGNLKTTILPEDIGFEPGKKILIDGQPATCFERLTDVPTGEIGITHGSSGFGNKRWLEVVIQRGNASKSLGLKIGSKVLANG